MNYQFNEGSLIIPNGTYQDMTLNLVSYPELQSTLVISRQKLKADEDYQGNYKKQLEQLKTAMENFTLLNLTEATFGKDQCVSGLESHATFKANGQLLEQYQCAFHYQGMLMVIGYSRIDKLGKEGMAHWKTIKDNFIPA